MLTITAIIRVRPGCAPILRDALLAVAAHVRANEPETLGFFISQDAADPHVFTTYERFVDQAAMDRHNNSAVVAHFFGGGETYSGRPGHVGDMRRAFRKVTRRFNIIPSPR